MPVWLQITFAVLSVLVLPALVCFIKECKKLLKEFAAQHARITELEQKHDLDVLALRKDIADIENRYAVQANENAEQWAKIDQLYTMLSEFMKFERSTHEEIASKLGEISGLLANGGNGNA